MMNQANEKLRIVRTQKQKITKKYDEIMNVLDKEERELLEILGEDL